MRGSHIFSSGGTTSGLIGGIGSVPNVCHSLCLGIVSATALFGITLNILPLMFLQTYQMYFWGAALIFTLASLNFFIKQRPKVSRDRNLLLINSGLLIFGLPVVPLVEAGLPIAPFLVDYLDFFRFIGISLTVVGLLLLTFGRKLQQFVYDGSEIYQEARIYSKARISKAPLRVTREITLPTVSVISLPRINVSSSLFVIIIGSFLINQFYMYKMGVFADMKVSLPITQTATPAMKPLSKMKLTAFDIILAKERMDKNNDGVCETCGMSMQQCIDSGQIDCNMGNNPEAIGVLGSAHEHADLNVYNNGQRLVFAKPENYMKSSFMHLDNSQNPADANSVLHMHAKKVPLWLFFRSLGMTLTKDSLTLSDGQVLKNGDGKTLKFYLDGKKVDELADYSFQPLDKLLISYGPENDPNLQTQIDSVTNYAKDHQK